MIANDQIDPAAALSTFPAFGATSLRLLDDLAARMRLIEVDGTAVAPPGLVAVLGGTSILSGGEVRAGHRATPGTYLTATRAGTAAATHHVQAEAKGTRVLVAEQTELEALLDASPALAYSVGFAAIDGLLDRHALRRVKYRCRRRVVERLWVCSARGLDVPVVALAHLLAAEAAEQFGEQAVVVTLGARPRVALWHPAPSGDGHALDHIEVATRPDEQLTDRAILRAVRRRRPVGPYVRIFFVDPTHPHEPPGSIAPGRFHRVVYVTRELPARMPRGLRPCLKPALFFDDGEPGFTAFVPTVISPVRRPAPGSWLDAAGRMCSPAEFRTAPIVDGAGRREDPPGTHANGRRMERDLCRVQLHVEAIAALWRRWEAGEEDGASFVAAVRRTHPGAGDGLGRWARAIANRQVGVGLSGGGACAYRAVPLLSMLSRRLGVPVDVVGGVSGGSVVGAYYAAYGLEGLELVVDRGPLFGWVVQASMIDSRAIAIQIDADLGGTRIEELETRFVPVATKLPDGASPPHGVVVVRGSCGEGVRVSGSAPGGFAPTQIGDSRYTDGFASTMVPGRVLRSYGADVVLACNCIPGPGKGQPLEGSVWGRFVYHRLPIVGRMIDAWISIAYLFEETSRRAGSDANVFVEFPSQGMPLVEMTEWGRAREIVQVARTQHGALLWERARTFAEMAKRVGRRPA